MTTFSLPTPSLSTNFTYSLLLLAVMVFFWRDATEKCFLFLFFFLNHDVCSILKNVLLMSPNFTCETLKRGDIYLCPFQFLINGRNSLIYFFIYLSFKFHAAGELAIPKTCPAANLKYSVWLACSHNRTKQSDNCKKG